MFETRSKLTAGQLADFTREMRALRPDDWDGDVFSLPEMELCQVVIAAGRKAGFYENGQAPTAEQQRTFDFDEAISEAEKILKLFNNWNKRREFSDEEKKST